MWSVPDSEYFLEKWTELGPSVYLTWSRRRSLRNVEEATASARGRRSTGLDSASRGPEARNCCVRCCNQSCHERSAPSSFVWLAFQPGSGQSFAETSGASARDCRQSCAETSECQPEVQVTQRKEAADAAQAAAKERERPSPGTHAALLQASAAIFSEFCRDI